MRAKLHIRRDAYRFSAKRMQYLAPTTNHEFRANPPPGRVMVGDHHKNQYCVRPPHTWALDLREFNHGRGGWSPKTTGHVPLCHNKYIQHV